MLTSIFPIGGAGGGKLVIGASGDVWCSGSSFKTLSITGLDFKPVAVAMERKSGNTNGDVHEAAIVPPVGAVATRSSSAMPTVSGYEFTDGGFSVTITTSWGWGSTITWYAYAVQ